MTSLEFIGSIMPQMATTRVFSKVYLKFPPLQIKINACQQVTIQRDSVVHQFENEACFNYVGNCSSCVSSLQLSQSYISMHK